MPDPKKTTPDSVLASLPSFAWSDVEAVRYEAALDTISLVMAWYSAKITDERRKPAPDEAAIAEWREARRQAGVDRDALDPSDHAAVASTQAGYGAVLRRLSDAPDA